MKKLLIWIIVVVLIGGVYYVVNRSSDNSEPNDSGTPSENTGDNFRPDPSNATFVFDGERVTLSGGSQEGPDENGFYSETRLLENITYGDVNGDEEEDAVVFLVRSGASSGVFIYLAGFVSSPTGYRSTEPVFLGDRISPQSITVANGALTVRFLDRAFDDPFSTEPTIPTTREFVYTSGELRSR